MNFDYTDAQKELKASLRRVLEGAGGLAPTRAVLEGAERPLHRPLWQTLAEGGWIAACLPEAHGGSGLGLVDQCALAEEFGRTLLPVPYASTVYALAGALALSGDDALQAELTPAIASGAVIGCLATSEGPGPVDPTRLTTRVEGGRLTGRKLPVADGDAATHAVVLAREAGEPALFLVDLSAQGVSRAVLETLDPSRGHAALTFEAVPARRVGPVGGGLALYERLLDRIATLLAFEQLGGADACLQMATDYAKSRHAFGQPIGVNQGIKHKLADIYVKNEIARSNAYYAAWAVASDAPELPEAAAAARVAATEAFEFAAKESIQTHGGIGYTWAMDCHLYFRRSRLLALQIGGPAVWKERLVRALERRNAA